MKVLVKRIFSNNRYTIAHVYVDGTYVCDSIEDTDRGWHNGMSDAWIRNNKVYAKSAIPIGTYNLTLNVVSPKFVQKAYYKKFCGGRLPRILNVPGFDGILMHRGATERDSAGCIILGYNKIKGQVVNSQEAFEKLYKILEEANKKKEKITIEITRTYKF